MDVQVAAGYLLHQVGRLVNGLTKDGWGLVEVYLEKVGRLIAKDCV